MSIVLKRIIKPAGLTLALCALSPFAFSRTRGDKESDSAQLAIHAGREACAVDLDGVAAGKTDARGNFLLREIEPSDHYAHVNCPGQPESTFFVSPQARESVEIQAGSQALTTASADPALDAAAAKIQLRQLIKDAVQLRASGHFDEAVQRLHDAVRMDPTNSDLHRELGITFLLVKEWNRARVEMLEAIRHEPDDADAHNSLGYALEKMGQLNAAVNEFRIATRLEPDDFSYREHYIDAVSRIMAQQAAKKK